jgi:hypothetical protein
MTTMGAPIIGSPPHYPPNNHHLGLTPRSTVQNPPKVSVITTPRSPGLYTVSSGDGNGSFSPTMSFSFGSSPRNILHPRGHLRPHSKRHYLRSGVSWIFFLAIAGGLNLLYQHFTRDSYSQVDYLWKLKFPNQDAASLLVAPFNDVAAPAEFPFPMPHSPQATAVFYHIFIPETDEGRKNSQRIIQEQLQQLASAKNHNYVLYFNTVGVLTEELNTDHINQWCQNRAITCHHMQHYNEGMEDKTLQHLHNFCSVSHTSTLEPDFSVVYLHNKGSFSTKPLNEAWRFQMTQAVVSNQCKKHTTNGPGECNLCGLYFSAERGLFMAGNMWRSKCSYVKSLLPPSTFQDAMHDVAAEAMFERLRYRLVMTLQELRAGVFGIDRYSTEFWIGSHPNVRPCDFSNAIYPPDIYDMTEVFLRWLRKKVKNENYKTPLLSKWFVPEAPQHPLPLHGSLDVQQFEDVRLREYFLLPGNLFRWYKLYGQAPPTMPASWVYRWFPDGERWKAAVQDHGKDSVSFVTQQALQMEIDSKRNKYTKDNSDKSVDGTAPPGATQRRHK